MQRSRRRRLLGHRPPRQNGQVLYTAATGIANRDFNAPVKLDTKFNLGSMNKMFTGVAAPQLVEKGKLAFDDPIGKYLGARLALPGRPRPGPAPAPPYPHLRARQLLQRRMGSLVPAPMFRNIDDYKPIVKSDTLAFTPGTQSQYSNTGMLLAGAVIQKASGQDYFDYIRANVTGPAGMTSTDSYEVDLVNPNLAVGYIKETTDAGTRYRNNLFMHVIKGGPAGGGYSTVEDLLKFDQALRSGKLLSKASLEKVRRRPTPISPRPSTATASPSPSRPPARSSGTRAASRASAPPSPCTSTRATPSPSSPTTGGPPTSSIPRLAN